MKQPKQERPGSVSTADAGLEPPGLVPDIQRVVSRGRTRAGETKATRGTGRAQESRDESRSSWAHPRVSAAGSGQEKPCADGGPRAGRPKPRFQVDSESSSLVPQTEQTRFRDFLKVTWPVKESGGPQPGLSDWRFSPCGSEPEGPGQSMLCSLVAV